MAEITRTGKILFSDPYDTYVSYDMTIDGQTGRAIDIWIYSGPTYSIESLTFTYNGVSVTVDATDDDAATVTAHIYEDFIYQRGVDAITVTGVKKDGSSVRFSDGGTSYALTWETPNTVPSAVINAGVPFAGRGCTVNWSYSDADGDAVELVSLARYWAASGDGTYTKTTLPVSGTETAYTDVLPSTSGGGTVYYEITFRDIYGGTGSAATEPAAVLANVPPTVPGVPVLPGRIYAGATVTATWAISSDADGNLEGYMLERSSNGTDGWVLVYKGASNTVETAVPSGVTTAAYRVCAYDTYGEMSAYAQTELLTVYTNNPPDLIAQITVPTDISVKRDSFLVSWSKSTDPDGDAVTYILERSIGGGAFEQVYSGETASFTDKAESGWGTVAYRVCAVDDKGARSPYKTSKTREVPLNWAPSIRLTESMDGANLGVFDDALVPPATKLSCAALDADGDTLTVYYTVDDGEAYVSYTSTKAGSLTFEHGMDPDIWTALPNGEHVWTATVTDGTEEASASVYFTKEVRDAVITLAQPIIASGPITVCVLSVTGEIPADAEMTVEVTNTAIPEPVWEDATAAVRAGINYAFTNTESLSGLWAFNFRITIHGGDTRGYVTSVQGAFQ